MGKHLTTRAAATAVAAPRVIHYLDPAQPAELMLYTAAQLAAKRRQDQILYARWLDRQVALAERDRKVRRFWLGFGLVAGTGTLAGLGVLGWLAWHAITAITVGALAIPLALLLLIGLAVGGHRCITVVQHWH